MKSTLPKRKRPSEPTTEQLKSAESAAFTAIMRGNTVLLAHHPSQQNSKTMKKPEKKELCQDGLSNLGKTPVEDFLSNFRVNGLECMTTAFE